MISRMLPVAFGIAALGLALGLTTCGSLHPAPEVGIAGVTGTPIAISDTLSDSNVTVFFFNGNRIDAVITTVEATGLLPVRVNVFVPYGVHPDSVLTS